jgi:hypothetical protein
MLSSEGETEIRFQISKCEMTGCSGNVNNNFSRVAERYY